MHVSRGGLLGTCDISLCWGSGSSEHADNIWTIIQKVKQEFGGIKYHGKYKSDEGSDEAEELLVVSEGSKI